MNIKTFNPPYPNKFQDGDIAVSLGKVNFTDGTFHKTGDEIIVTEETVSYYNAFVVCIL
jgi:hypothetical protein